MTQSLKAILKKIAKPNNQSILTDRVEDLERRVITIEWYLRDQEEIKKLKKRKK